MIVMPIILAAVTILGLTKFYRSNIEQKYKIDSSEYSFLGNSIQLPDQYSKAVYDQLMKAYKESPENMTDVTFLKNTNARLAIENAFIILRDGDKIVYDGSVEDKSGLYELLPKYRGQDPRDPNMGIYISAGFDVLVRQLDFTNSQVEKGSLFLVTPAQETSPE